MFSAVTPIGILQSHATALVSQLPRVYDGEAEGVHDARVLTRRIREVLPLTYEWHGRDTVEDFADELRRMARGFGRVRDADVRIALLSYLETRVPYVTASLVVVRHEREHERIALMRKLIERLEKVDVERLLHRIAGGRRLPIRPWTRLAGGWRERLRCTLADRAHSAGEAVQQASGVYFPDRMHRARIALKKFRYAAEIAATTGVGASHARRSLRQLKKSQDTLGELRDRQVLVEELPDAVDGNPDVDRHHVRLVIEIAEAECRDLHARYLRRRDRLLTICHRTEHACAERGVPIAPLAAAGAVALTSGLYWWRRSNAREPEEAAVSVRIPIPDAASVG